MEEHIVGLFLQSGEFQTPGQPKRVPSAWLCSLRDLLKAVALPL